MTISSTASEISYAGNGATVAFAIPFPFDTSADIKVTSTVTATGDVSVLSSGFAITGGGGSTGTITFTIAPASTVSITLIDDPARTQPTDYVANDAFPAESHERALDRVTRLCKRLYQRSLRSLRVPDGDPVTDAELAPVSTRKGKYLFFDAITGAIDYAANIVTTTLSQGTIGALLYPRTAAEISASVTPTNYAYQPGHVYRYGTNSTPGTTDMSTAFQNAALSSLNPYAPRDLMNVTGSIPLRDGQCWRLDGTEFVITGNTQVFTVAAGIDDWSIRGDWTVTGDNGAAGATSGTGAALVIIDSMRFWVDGPNAKNIKGWGVLVQPGSSTSNRSEKGTISNLRATACYIGAETQPNNGGEYVNFVSPMISRCATGLKATAGNTNVTGGSISDNTVGVYLLNGSNGQHGMFVGTNINHNTTYNVSADGITNGHSFVGCHLYQGDIYLKNSTGVMFEACFVDPASYYFEGSNACGFRNCVMPVGYANTINNNYNASPSYTIWDNCKKLDGSLYPTTTDGMYKGLRVKATSPGLTYTPANLTAEQTVLLTDNENFTAEAAQTLYDGYVAGTGLFTCRGLGDGKVRVNATFNCTNNAADDAFATGMGYVYMYVRKNGAFYRWLGRVRLTTTKVHFFTDMIIEMAKNDTLDFRIGQAGGAVANNVTIATAETACVVEGL